MHDNVLKIKSDINLRYEWEILPLIMAYHRRHTQNTILNQIYIKGSLCVIPKIKKSIILAGKTFTKKTSLIIECTPQVGRSLSYATQRSISSHVIQVNFQQSVIIFYL